MASKLVETAQSASKTAQAAQAEVGAQVGKLIKKVQSRVQEVQGSLQATVQTKVPQITDQMLLNLSHSGSQILQQTLQRIEQNPHDLVGRVGRAVLERAASVRAQMLESERIPQPVKKTLEEWGAKAPSVVENEVAVTSSSSTLPGESASAPEAQSAKASAKKLRASHAASKGSEPADVPVKKPRAKKSAAEGKKVQSTARRKSTPSA
jgi:hypothetical protein